MEPLAPQIPGQPTVPAVAESSKGMAGQGAKRDIFSDFRWIPYTPVWTTTGTTPANNASFDGTKYMFNGKLLIVRFRIVIGASGGMGSGDWRFSLPVEVSTALSAVGIGLAIQTGVQEFNAQTVRIITSKTFTIVTGVGAHWSKAASVPFNWAAGDAGEATFVCEVL